MLPIIIINLMMEAAGSSETSVSFYQTTRRNNSEDSRLRYITYIETVSLNNVRVRQYFKAQWYT
jgi:hypothetical protein